MRRAAKVPQRIRSRSRLVAVVIDPESFQEFPDWKARAERKTVADAFAELRALASGPGPLLKAPGRRDRPNPFAARNDGLPR